MLTVSEPTHAYNKLDAKYLSQLEVEWVTKCFSDAYVDLLGKIRWSDHLSLRV